MLKKVTLLACLFAIVSLPTACSPDDVSGKQQDNNQIPVLKVYYVESGAGTDYHMDQMERATINYIVNYPGKCKIERTVFKSDQYEQYRSTLATDLLTGQGPDILFIEDETFPSIRKVMASGVFCDLNELIEKDREFDLSDYNKTIMDSGVYKGKRYLVPWYYELPVLMTVKSVTDGNDISTGRVGTWDGLMGEAEKFAGFGEKDARYFLVGDFKFSDIVESCGSLFVDYDKKKTGFDSGEFIRLLEIYKELHSVQYSAKIGKDLKTRLGVGPSEDNLSVFGVSKFYSSPFRFELANSEALYFYKEDLLLYPFPSFRQNDGINVVPACFLAINSKCKNKEAAFDFIKIALSEREQSMWEYENGTLHVMMGLPVNNKALDTTLELFSRDMYLRNQNNDIGIPSVDQTFHLPESSISREQAGMLKSLVGGIGSSCIIDKTILDMLDQEIQDFLKGRKTAKQTARLMDNKATLFLNE